MTSDADWSDEAPDGGPRETGAYSHTGSRSMDYTPVRPGHVVPAKAQTFAMAFFLASLGMLFGATMVGFIIIRLAGTGRPELGFLRPALTNWKLFTSTTIVLLASVTIHLAIARVRHERIASFKRYLLATDVLAALFVAIQTPAMLALLRLDHAGVAGGQRPESLYAFVFILILIHALHVVGGVVYLAIVTTRAYAGRYDHEHHTGVRHAALYWHFLDIVWLFMFGTLMVLG